MNDAGRNDDEINSGFDLEPDEDSSQTFSSMPKLVPESQLVLNLYRKLLEPKVKKQVDEIMESSMGSTEGEITFYRVQQHYHKRGDFSANEQDIKKFIKSYDLKNSGRVTRSMLAGQLTQQLIDANVLQIREIEANLRQRSNEAFNEADTDGDGFLCPRELKSFLLRVEQELGEDFAREVGQAADREKGISAEEFF